MKDIALLNEETEDKVVPIATRRKALRSGGGENTIEGNWLSQLRPGTEFATSGGGGQEPQWLLREWVLVGHKHGVSYVAPARLLNNEESWMTVKPKDFSKAFVLEAILYTDQDDE